MVSSNSNCVFSLNRPLNLVRRFYQPGATWFFTVNLAERKGLIKGNFSRGIEKGGRISTSRVKRGEWGLWQRRFWDHLIRDATDCQWHSDYIHWNPVKHGLVHSAADWTHSGFHLFLRRGLYPVKRVERIERRLDMRD